MKTILPIQKFITIMNSMSKPLSRRFDCCVNAFKVLLQSIAVLLSVSFAMASNAGESTTVTYYHTDALGSIVAASDEQGDVVWKRSYDAYGNEVFSTEVGQPYEGQAYTGKTFDEETGLLYLGQRYYDPELRRFLSMDSVGYVANNPTSFNRYAYANNNPYRFVDPDGRQAISIIAPPICIGCEPDVNERLAQSQINGLALTGPALLVAAPFASCLSNIICSYALGTASFMESGNPIDFVSLGKTGNTILSGATKGGSKALQLLPEFSNSRKAFEHYAKHSKGIVLGKRGKATLKRGGADVPEFTSLSSYVGAAKSFWSPSARRGILQGTRADGAILRFEPSTGYFGVMRNGRISTFFRPDGNSAARLKYFRDQL